MNLPDDSSIDRFCDSLKKWKFGIGSVEIRYATVVLNGKEYLQKAYVTLFSNLFKNCETTLTKASRFSVGKITKNLDPSSLEKFIEKLFKGIVEVEGLSLSFPKPSQPLFFSSSQYARSFDSFTDKAIIRAIVKSDIDLPSRRSLDAELRLATPPFDGLEDLLSFYGFSNPNQMPTDFEIEVSLMPPVECEVSYCSIENNHLHLRLKKHPQYPKNDVFAAIKLFPNPSLDRRFLISEEISWASDSEMHTGEYSVQLEDTNAVTVLLSAGGITVNRYTLFDKNNSLNPRLKTFAKFDKDLAMLRKFLDNVGGKRNSFDLEWGTAALFYLHGFAVVIPPETEAPDIIVESRSGRIALVECTTAVNDIRKKAGQLVRRRYELMHSNGNQPTDKESHVLTILIVNQPKAQIVSDSEHLLENKILLLTKEDLDLALQSLEFPRDTDDLFESAVRKLEHAISTPPGLR